MMPDSGELWGKPDFQQRLSLQAESWLDINRLLTQPTVIFDRGYDEFWTTVMNSGKANLIVEQIKEGNLIPINADALGDIATVHTAFHVYLAEAGIATIPTIGNIDGKIGSIGRYKLTQEIPGVFVRKTGFENGKLLSHGGAGVSIIHVNNENIVEVLPKNKWEFLQPFVVPPDRYIRDIRVYLVGGKPVTGLVRRAREPLRDENLSGQLLPVPDQYPSAQHPGVNEVLTEELKVKVYPLAQKIVEILDLKVRTRKRPYSPISTFGFGSIDFLLDSNGQPLPVDFDISPSVSKFEGINLQVAESLAELLRWLSQYKDVAREIMVIGFPDDDFAKRIVALLADKQTSVTFKESLVYTILKEMK